jgi:hypothetical protein
MGYIRQGGNTKKKIIDCFDEQSQTEGIAIITHRKLSPDNSV